MADLPGTPKPVACEFCGAPRHTKGFPFGDRIWWAPYGPERCTCPDAVAAFEKAEAERKAKQERRRELTEQLSASRENEQSVDAWLDMVQDYYNLEELDRPTLVRLIQKIEVGEKRMVDGHEERDFNIYYNFIGHIDL